MDNMYKLRQGVKMNELSDNLGELTIAHIGNKGVQDYLYEAFCYNIDNFESWKKSTGSSISNQGVLQHWENFVNTNHGLIKNDDTVWTTPETFQKYIELIQYNLPIILLGGVYQQYWDVKSADRGFSYFLNSITLNSQYVLVPKDISYGEFELNENTETQEPTEVSDEHEYVEDIDNVVKEDDFPLASEDMGSEIIENSVKNVDKLTITALRIENDKLFTKIDHLEEEIALLKSKDNDYTNKMDEIIELENKNKKYIEELNNTLEQFSNDIKLKDAEIIELKKNNVDKDIEIDKLKTSYAEIDEKISKLTTSNEEKDKEIDKLKMDYTEKEGILNNNYQELSERVKQNMKEIIELETENQLLKDEIDNLNKAKIFEADNQQNINEYEDAVNNALISQVFGDLEEEELIEPAVNTSVPKDIDLSKLFDI